MLYIPYSSLAGGYKSVAVSMAGMVIRSHHFVGCVLWVIPVHEASEASQSVEDRVAFLELHGVKDKEDMGEVQQSWSRQRRSGAICLENAKCSGWQRL